MQKIDVHTHMLPRHIPDFKAKYGYGGFVTLDHHAPCRARMLKDDGTFFREIEENCFESKARLVDIDKTDVSVQVISTVPVMFSYWAKPQDTHDLSCHLNDHIASVCQEHPERFVGTMTEKLMTYALGRGLEYYDMPVVRSIARDSARSDYRFSSIVMGIVKSTPFQMKRAREVETPAATARLIP